MARLLRPVLAFAAVWLLLPLALGRLGLPGEQVELVGKVIGQPLWFLGVYLVVVALAPPMVRLHRRFRLWVPVTLAVAAAAVDALRLAAGIQEIGYLNLLLVWVLVQQVGFFYADGTLERLSRRALAGLAAAGLAGLVVLTGTGLYPPSMVGLPGDESNMSPPTVCIVALTVWQVGLVMLARARVSAWLARRGSWTAVIAVGSMAMTCTCGTSPRWSPSTGSSSPWTARCRPLARERGGRPGRCGWRCWPWSSPRWRWPCPASSGPAATRAPRRGPPRPPAAASPSSSVSSSSPSACSASWPAGSRPCSTPTAAGCWSCASTRCRTWSTWWSAPRS